MKDIQQLIKKNSQEGRYEDIFPKTFTDAVSKEFASVQFNSIHFLINKTKMLSFYRDQYSSK